MESNVQYIDTDSKLKKVVEILSTKPSIYIDLEFDKNNFRYGFHLCLMQIFDGETTYLIDPISTLNIQNIFPIIENPSIQKVCYAFNEDMRLLYYLGAHPQNILDLSIILHLLNYDTLSLHNALVKFLELEEVGEKKKSQQKSNWIERPLTLDQRKYAEKDVIYLPLLEKKLVEIVQKFNRESWVQQEMKAFEKQDWEAGETAQYLTRKDRKQLSMREWIRFEKLMTFREEVAKKLNRPTFKVIRKEIILEIAKNPPAIKTWSSIKGTRKELRTKSFQEKIELLLKEAERIIINHNISVEEPAISLISQEEKERKRAQSRRLRELNISYFQPIKDYVTSEFGQYFSQYILSKRKIDLYSRESLQLLPYQKEIFTTAARQLQLKESPI